MQHVQNLTRQFQRQFQGLHSSKDRPLFTGIPKPFPVPIGHIHPRRHLNAVQLNKIHNAKLCKVARIMTLLHGLVHTLMFMTCGDYPSCNTSKIKIPKMILHSINTPSTRTGLQAWFLWHAGKVVAQGHRFLWTKCPNGASHEIRISYKGYICWAIIIHMIQGSMEIPTQISQPGFFFRPEFRGIFLYTQAYKVCCVVLASECHSFQRRFQTLIWNLSWKPHKGRAWERKWTCSSLLRMPWSFWLATSCHLVIDQPILAVPGKNERSIFKLQQTYGFDILGGLLPRALQSASIHPSDQKADPDDTWRNEPQESFRM